MNFVSNNGLSMLGGDDLSSINQSIIDLDASVVHKTGYQTENINGLKTFTSNLTVNNTNTAITATTTSINGLTNNLNATSTSPTGATNNIIATGITGYPANNYMTATGISSGNYITSGISTDTLSTNTISINGGGNNSLISYGTGNTGSTVNLITNNSGNNAFISSGGTLISSNQATSTAPPVGSIYSLAATIITNYIGTIAKLTQTAALTTIANTTIALSGTANTMTAVTSNIISTNSTSSGSSNQLLANGSATYPSAFNLIQAAGYGGYNIISALNQAGSGFNTIEAWNSNQISTGSVAGSNTLLSSGVSGSNSILASSTNGYNTMVASATGGANTISSSANGINGATTFNDYTAGSSAVTIQNSNGINVVNATTHATYNASSVPLMSLSASWTFNNAPISTVYIGSTQCDTASFGTTIQGGMAFPSNVVPVGYYIGSDTGAISSSPVNVTIEVFQYPSTTLAISTGALTFTTLASSNYNGKFTTPTASAAGNAYGVSINLTTSVVSNSKKFRVIIWFAQW